MGWLWATPAASATAPPASESQTSAASRQAKPSPPPAAADADVDPEAQKFLAMIQAELAGTSSTQPGAEQPPAPALPAPEQPARQKPARSSWFSSRPSATSREASAPQRRTATPDADQSSPDTRPAGARAIAESLLPTSMSCRQAFDQAFYCQSPGGQWNAVYRHGSVQSCSEHWGDFWFCMRAKGATGAVKENLIREHYRKKGARKYGAGRPSSEDVWESRTERVRPGEAFSEPYDVPQESDAEWQAREMERREEIRRTLGYKS